MHIIKIDTNYKNDIESLNETIVNGFLKYCGENACGYLIERVIYSDEEIYIYLKDFVSKLEYENTVILLKSIYRVCKMLHIRTGLEYKSSVIDEDLIEANKRYLYMIRIDCIRNTGATDEQCLDFIKTTLSDKTIKEAVNIFSLIWPIDCVIDYIVEISSMLNLNCINISCIDKKMIYGWRLTEYFSDVLSVLEKMTDPLYIGKNNKKIKLKVNTELNKISCREINNGEKFKYISPSNEVMH